MMRIILAAASRRSILTNGAVHGNAQSDQSRLEAPYEKPVERFYGLCSREECAGLFHNSCLLQAVLRAFLVGRVDHVDYPLNFSRDF